MMLQATAMTDLRSELSLPALSAREAAVDEALDESFPASDPPAWIAGIARARPRADAERRVAASRVAIADVIDLSRPPGSEATFMQRLGSVGAASAVVLVVPFAMLAIGLPLALAVRGVVEVVQWLIAILR